MSKQIYCGKGKSWGVEWKRYTDRDTGAAVRQLTDYYAHHYHVYFTNNGWYDGGRKLLMGGDRENKYNLYSIDLTSGEIIQLTDYTRITVPDDANFQCICVNPTKDEAYFWDMNRLTAIDLTSLDERVIWEAPKGYMRTILNVTSDGQYVIGSLVKDLSDTIETDLQHGYVGFEEIWAAKPHSMIYKTPICGGDTKIVFEDNCWIGHVNTSPAQPGVITFCHEGPWEKVDHRIWALNHDDGKVWKIRERKSESETIGHEYWYADGVTIGYHGADSASGHRFFGRIRYDNSCESETLFPYETGHIHSNDEKFIVGDGNPNYVLIWRYCRDNNTYEGPRALCIHASSRHQQFVHVHPRFSKDGSQVVFTSDRTGYGSPYIVDVPEFDTLPEIK